MGRIAFVTDSIAALPADQVKKYNVTVVPLQVVFGTEVFRDGVDLSPAELYERLAAGGVTATTSTPTPADFLAAFRASGALEVVFRGIDSGTVDGRSESIRFERSLGIGDARGAQVLLAHAMNGEPLPVQHGYPLRVIVPGWYAVASVKWLVEIEVTGEPFQGHYQTDRYVYEWQRDGRLVRELVTLQRVRSLITEPEADAEIERGELAIRGVAWSGAAPIARVDVSVNGGPWLETRLVGERKRHSWQWWEFLLRVDEPGTVEIQARAADMASRTQPDEPEWNRLGYGNNAVQKIRVQVK